MNLKCPSCGKSHEIDTLKVRPFEMIRCDECQSQMWLDKPQREQANLDRLTSKGYTRTQ